MMVVFLVEVYLTEDNLKNDYTLAKYERENDGWIPVQRLNQFNKLSTYKYETVLNALLAKRSNVIELDLCEPASLRRRRQPLIEPSIKQNPYLYQTVVVNGLPRDSKHDELMTFFNRFYPVHKIKMLPSSRAAHLFSGKIHVVFEKCQDALAFVQQSESVSLIYVNEYVLQLCNGYTLICKMLIDCDDKVESDLIKQTDQLRLENGQ
jgi:predicted ribosome quality control (RQC) complex YloA/Tae2 family protein